MGGGGVTFFLQFLLYCKLCEHWQYLYAGVRCHVLPPIQPLPTAQMK